MAKRLCVLGVAFMFVLGCKGESASSGGAGSAAPSGDAPCTAVVEKMASMSPGSGEPEKKLWAKACEVMPAPMKACIVASKTKAELDQCGKGQKPISQ